jgi:hypothetical protein
MKKDASLRFNFRPDAYAHHYKSGFATLVVENAEVTVGSSQTFHCK